MLAELYRESRSGPTRRGGSSSARLRAYDPRIRSATQKMIVARGEHRDCDPASSSKSLASHCWCNHANTQTPEPYVDRNLAQRPGGSGLDGAKDPKDTHEP